MRKSQSREEYLSGEMAPITSRLIGIRSDSLFSLITQTQSIQTPKNIPIPR